MNEILKREETLWTIFIFGIILILIALYLAIPSFLNILYPSSEPIPPSIKPIPISDMNIYSFDETTGEGSTVIFKNVAVENLKSINKPINLLSAGDDANRVYLGTKTNKVCYYFNLVKPSGKSEKVENGDVVYIQSRCNPTKYLSVVNNKIINGVTKTPFTIQTQKNYPLLAHSDNNDYGYITFEPSFCVPDLTTFDIEMGYINNEFLISKLFN